MLEFVHYFFFILGLGGSMSFLKNELYLQTNYRIVDDCVIIF